jgi:predicted DNA-binding transcriptional regulator YafY
VIFEKEAVGTQEIKFWILSWGSQAEVLEPESLRDEIRAESEALLMNYAGTIERMESILNRRR